MADEVMRVAISEIQAIRLKHSCGTVCEIEPSKLANKAIIRCPGCEGGNLKSNKDNDPYFHLGQFFTLLANAKSECELVIESTGR
jgi:hypothetical protein